MKTDVADDETENDQKHKRGAAAAAKAKAGVDVVRLRLAQLIWLVCVLAALVLAIGALLIALGDSVNRDNELVTFVLNLADKLDFGVFSRDDGVAHWKGHSQSVLTKNACVNWGLAAVVWLVAGQVISKLVRPRNA